MEELNEIPFSAKETSGFSTRNNTYENETELIGSFMNSVATEDNSWITVHLHENHDKSTSELIMKEAMNDLIKIPFFKSYINYDYLCHTPFEEKKDYTIKIHITEDELFHVIDLYQVINEIIHTQNSSGIYATKLIPYFCCLQFLGMVYPRETNSLGFELELMKLFAFQDKVIFSSINVYMSYINTHPFFSALNIIALGSADNYLSFYSTDKTKNPFKQVTIFSEFYHLYRSLTHARVDKEEDGTHLFFSKDHFPTHHKKVEYFFDFVKIIPQNDNLMIACWKNMDKKLFLYDEKLNLVHILSDIPSIKGVASFGPFFFIWSTTACECDGCLHPQVNVRFCHNGEVYYCLAYFWKNGEPVQVGEVYV
jgi:hypothetical protein